MMMKVNFLFIGQVLKEAVKKVNETGSVMCSKFRQTGRKNLTGQQPGFKTMMVQGIVKPLNLFYVLPKPKETGNKMDKSRKTKRQLSAEQTQIKIKNTVIDLMSDKDFENITIREICRVAGVSVGTFYLYFQSKEAALLYSHRSIDEMYETADFSDCQNAVGLIQKIMWMYLSSISSENFKYIRHIYIAHITCYTEYLFSRKKKMYKVLSSAITRAREQGMIKSGISKDDIFRRLMVCARGQVYDYCINPANSNAEEWLLNAYSDWCDYLTLYFTPKGMRAFKAAPPKK